MKKEKNMLLEVKAVENIMDFNYEIEFNGKKYVKAKEVIEKFQRNLDMIVIKGMGNSKWVSKSYLKRLYNIQERTLDDLLDELQTL
ncbi:hypothetical protein HJU46_08445 [Clostridium butyricum]|jgi:hypothetical protein|nr:hypothetical protein [Clostridium butyricum]